MFRHQRAPFPPRGRVDLPGRVQRWRKSDWKSSRIRSISAAWRRVARFVSTVTDPASIVESIFAFGQRVAVERSGQCWRVGGRPSFEPISPGLASAFALSTSAPAWPRVRIAGALEREGKRGNSRSLRQVGLWRAFERQRGRQYAPPVRSSWRPFLSVQKLQFGSFKVSISKKNRKLFPVFWRSILSFFLRCHGFQLALFMV